MSASIFNHTDCAQYLAQVFAAEKKAREHFTLQTWAEELGMSHPMTLSRDLNGKRGLRPDLAKKIAVRQGLDAVEAEYLGLLAHLSQAKSRSDRELLEKLLEEKRALHRKSRSRRISPRQFDLLGEWYAWVILQMTLLADFQSDPAWISKRLGGNPTPEQVTEALERLQQLGFLKVGESGKLENTSSEQLQTGWEFPDSKIQSFHRKMLDLASAALRKQTLRERDFSANTLSIDTAHIPKIKELIKGMHTKASRFSARAGTARETYQLNVQLFRVTPV